MRRAYASAYIRSGVQINGDIFTHEMVKKVAEEFKVPVETLPDGELQVVLDFEVDIERAAKDIDANGKYEIPFSVGVSVRNSHGPRGPKKKREP